MNQTEKAGWIALAGSCFAIIAALGVFLTIGPGSSRREISRLSTPSVFQAVVEPAIQLLESLPEGASLSSADPQAGTLRHLLAPASFSFIAKRDHELLIECGGGFLHYGYRLIRRADDSYVLILEVEEQKDRLLVTRAVERQNT